jgi:hypothetical protein
LEVKNEWSFDDPVVLAKKDAATKLASNSLFEYEMLTAKQFKEFFAGLVAAGDRG